MTQGTEERFLSIDDEAQLLGVARHTLDAWVRDGKRLELSLDTFASVLQERHGAFVTLRKGHELRGCVGYPRNVVPLVEAVRENTINAASNDVRFLPVEREELSDIRIDISALAPGDTPESPFKRVHSPAEIVLGRDGVFIQRPPDRGGLLLPQVALEHGFTLEQFLEAVCRKAGYPMRAWKQSDTQLFRFSAQVFSEG